MTKSSIIMCGRHAWNKGIPHTEEQKQKLRENHKGMTGRKHSEETKQKMRESKLTHGMSGTREYGLLAHAKERAKRLGIVCELTVHDIHIPETCPVLGIPLEHGVGKQADSSPTIDRVDIRKAYTPDNIEVVSLLANRIKSSAYSSEQVQLVADWMRKRGL